MTAHDFRIGNLLLCDEKPARVTAINTTLPKVTISFDNDRVATLESGRIQAIELTAEWLGKCGFKKEVNEWIGTSSPIHLVNIKQPWKTAPTHFVVYSRHFKLMRRSCPDKVHQLQNFIYCITDGQELTISL